MTSSVGAPSSFASSALTLEARGLAASPADLGQARYLLGSGCPPPLALTILS